MKNKDKALQVLDKPYYRYWQALYYSFFKKNLYVDVVKRWRGLALGYLLLVLAIVTIPLVVQIARNFNDYFNKNVIQPISNLPPITIQNGQVVFDKPMPFFVKNDKGQVVAIIDTTGTITTATKEYPDLVLLFTKNKMLLYDPQFKFAYVDPKPSPPTVQEFQPTLNQVFDGREWLKSSNIYATKYASLFAIFPVIIMIFFVLYATFFLVFAMFAQLMAVIFAKASLTYLQSYRLLIVSCTPHLVLMMMIMAWNYIVPGVGIFLIALLAIYYMYGALAVRKDTQGLVRL